MNEIATMTARRMSSREIAELTGKEHEHVMRDVRLLIEQWATGGAESAHGGHIINHLAKGDLKLDEVTTEKVWQVFSGFMLEMRDPYLLEPLRRKGLLPAPEPEPEQGSEA